MYKVYDEKAIMAKSFHKENRGRGRNPIFLLPPIEGADASKKYVPELFAKDKGDHGNAHANHG